MEDHGRQIEEGRARLRQEANALRERCGTDRHPTDEEVREFCGKVAAFAGEALSPGSSLFGVLRD